MRRRRLLKTVDSTRVRLECPRYYPRSMLAENCPIFSPPLPPRSRRDRLRSAATPRHPPLPPFSRFDLDWMMRRKVKSGSNLLGRWLFGPTSFLDSLSDELLSRPTLSWKSRGLCKGTAFWGYRKWRERKWNMMHDWQRKERERQMHTARQGQTNRWPASQEWL